MSPQRTGSPQRRAEVVAGIRALADLIETNLDLPVPQSVRAQHSAIGGLTDEARDTILAAARALGVEAETGEHNGRAYITASRDIAHGYNADDGSYFTSYTAHAIAWLPQDGAR